MSKRLTQSLTSLPLAPPQQIPYASTMKKKVLTMLRGAIGYLYKAKTRLVNFFSFILFHCGRRNCGSFKSLIFIWKTYLGWLPTSVTLAARKVPTSIAYVLYNRGPETHMHAL
ncbi:hypothetical protein ACOSQ2_031088 [Xanthoceras sorbifolium]